MRKRFLCILLATVLLLSLVAAVPMPVRAQSNLKTSEPLIKFLQNYEGWAPYQMWDVSQYSVGYGTRVNVCSKGYSGCPGYPNCPDKNCEFGKWVEGNPITEEEATRKMQAFLTGFENHINSFANKYGITLTQNEFDALISLTYNCGGGWTTDKEGILRDAIVNRATGDQLVYAFGLYSKSEGKPVSLGHVRRRMMEADIYLNGNYSKEITNSSVWPEDLRYVYLDGNRFATSYMPDPSVTALATEE